MKINLERIMITTFLLVFTTFSIYTITSSSDTYQHYIISKEILKNPNFLWTGENIFLTSTTFGKEGKNIIYAYPPFIHLIYAFFLLFNIPFKILNIVMIFIIGLSLWLLERKSIFFMFLSFLFVRSVAFGGEDLFLLILTLLCYYFFDKRPILSGIFAGLAPLVKGIGFFILFSYFLSVLIFKNKEIIKKDFYKNDYFLSFILMILILLPWYLRNFILFKGDLFGTIVGQSLKTIGYSEQLIETGFQATQPERYWWDTSGFYPLPIDLLFYTGIIFTFFNIFKKRKIELEHIFIIIFISFYFISQALNFSFLMTIRYQLSIFPLLAFQILKGIPEKYLKYSFIICLAFFIYFSLNLPKYSFNQLDVVMDTVCKQAKEQIDDEPVYVNAFHNWYTIYKCNLNATIQEESKWTLDLYQGKLYPTNKIEE
ncbi:MAG: hypothetical protein QXD43_00170 [Candidatus Aenigmatarchaeota archaeon]